MTIRKEVIGDATLYCGDCLEVLPTLGKVDAVITDPPYAIPTQVASGRTITRNVGDLSIIEGACRQHLALWKSMLGEDGRICVFCDGASYSVIYRAAYGCFSLASLVWDKGQIGMGREFRKRHELIIHGWGACTPVVSSDGIGHADVIERRPVGVSKRQHPAEKPVELVGDMLRVCGEKIVDPFMGSGTTGVSCALSGKHFIGIEIEPKYFEVACRRIEDAYRATPRLAIDVPQKPVQTDMLGGAP